MSAREGAASRAGSRSVRTALVTGASGFVGRELVRQLAAAGAEVIGTSRSADSDAPELRFLDLPEIVDEDLFKYVDTVFHLAGRAHALSDGSRRTDAYDAVNRLGTLRLAEAAARAGAERFVFVSSVKATGEPSQDIEPESSTRQPNDPYGVSKRRAEEGLYDLARQTQLEVVVARPTLVYGPGVKGNLEVLAKSILRGSPPPLPRTTNRRSLIAVGDVAGALRLLATHPDAAGRTFVLTDGEVYSTERLISALATAAGAKSEPRFRVPMWCLATGARLGDALQGVIRRPVPLSTEKLRRLVGNAEYESEAIRRLGFRPTTTFEDAAPDIVRCARD